MSLVRWPIGGYKRLMTEARFYGGKRVFRAQTHDVMVSFSDWHMRTPSGGFLRVGHWYRYAIVDNEFMIMSEGHEDREDAVSE